MNKNLFKQLIFVMESVLCKIKINKCMKIVLHYNLLMEIALRFFTKAKNR
jgi:hypothetical protein